MGLMDQSPSTVPPGTGGIKAPPSAIPPGTGGIKPVRPTKPIKPVNPAVMFFDPALFGPPDVVPVNSIPRPKPRPRPVVDPIPVDTDPPVKDPNIIGYAADGSPIYPWGPRPHAPKPVKDELEPVGQIDPYQTPPIIPASKLPPAPEAS
jgi:hypothetical protein